MFQNIDNLQEINSSDSQSEDLKIFAYTEKNLNNSQSREKVLKLSIHQINNRCNLKCALLKNENNFQQQSDKDSTKKYMVQHYQLQRNIEFQGKKCCAIIMEKAPFSDLGTFNNNLIQYLQVKNNNNQLSEKILSDDIQLQQYELYKQIMIQCAKSLKQLHNNGIMHNDVKYDNFYVFDFDIQAQKFDIKIADLEYSVKESNLQNVQQLFQIYSLKNQINLSPEIEEQVNLKKINKLHKFEINDIYAYDIYSFGQMMLEFLLLTPFRTIKNEIAFNYFQQKKYSEFLNEIPLQKKVLLTLYNNKKIKILWKIFDIVRLCLNSDPLERPNIDELSLLLEEL
ncbi:Protein kinase-like domain [Pseudocohnilembus persalinus]|uniref:Protein kinase-like domain n=1 Tax=Pseudocohnilembus persalinus TaxID=266149 RepID=A0A0V0QP20_PSEPJ|nr:Protein kinase-like domain [Pseudocohnilembus persalinus]|eukprot:KRX03911.1 Protein kinase-like domain [Pseudocohnilembus persalinus]